MIRTLLVDDEPPARQLLREYLAEFDQVALVGECGNGREAVAVINAESPDLVFLDVQMPGLTGFEVLEHLDRLPHLIFSTAYDQFALDAFEAGAVDYLLKPYSRARFRKAMDRFLARHGQAPPDPQQLARLLQATQQPPTRYPERFFVKAGDRIVPVATADLRWAEAAGDYTRLHTAAGTYLCNLGIGALEARLDPARFVRIHRSTILALSALHHLASDGEGGYHVTLEDGRKLRVSRSYAPQVRDLIV